MGEITNIQKKFNEENFEEQTIEKKHNIKGFKDYASLLAPNAEKRFKLDKKLRKAQVNGRVTIAAIATALALGGGGIVASSHTEPTKQEQTVNYEEVKENELIKDASKKLLDCVFGEERSDIEEPYIRFNYDKSDNGYTIKVGYGATNAPKIKFTYSTVKFSDKLLNNKDVVELMDNMINISYKDELTEKDYQKLSDALEKLEDKNYKLNDKGYIVEENEKDKDNDNER